MAQVSLQINGYGYILGCADGEEEHLFALASDLDRRIEEIKASSGPSGEARLLLMAALLLADELHELRDQREVPATQAGPAEKPDPKISKRLRGLAKRAEAIADSTEPLPLTDPPPRTDAGMSLTNGSAPDSEQAGSPGRHPARTGSEPPARTNFEQQARTSFEQADENA